MPYKVKKRKAQWCVYNEDKNEVVEGGCHDSKDKAVTHLRALYANVKDAKK